MALSISILKNILDFKCMHIESFEIAEVELLFTKHHSNVSHDHHFKWWFDFSPLLLLA